VGSFTAGGIAVHTPDPGLGKEPLQRVFDLLRADAKKV
jgi:hypothetical protein